MFCVYDYEGMTESGKSVQWLNMQTFVHKWLRELFSEETKVPGRCLKLEKWQGPPHVNKVKQYETRYFSCG